MSRISQMVGKTMVSVFADRDEMVFTATDGTVFTFYHEQDCCENVRIVDICGDLDDLTGSPIPFKRKSLVRRRKMTLPNGRKVALKVTILSLGRFISLRRTRGALPSGG